ncbi:MAG: hypothetical protein ACI9FU_002473 [Granulosicoccus sp.]|jgi:hypothetical protein
MWYKVISFVVALSLGTIAQSQEKDCGRLSSSSFRKSVCSSIENNKAYLVKYQLQKKSGEQSLSKILKWSRENYDCIICRDEPGFAGGTLLRKVVFEDALSVAFFFVYEAKVDLNAIEADGKTLLDWIQEDTESNFDAMFETDNENDQHWMLKQININTRYYNLFRDNGARLEQELSQ